MVCKAVSLCEGTVPFADVLDRASEESAGEIIVMRAVLQNIASLTNVIL